MQMNKLFFSFSTIYNKVKESTDGSHGLIVVNDGVFMEWNISNIYMKQIQHSLNIAIFY